MKHRLMGSLVGCALFLLVLAGISAANDSAVVGEGGTVKAMKDHPSIRMASEKVNVWISGDEAKVECTFVFENTGPATTVLMGFPESGGGDIRVPKPGKGFLQFRAYVDGKPVETRLMREKEGEDGVSYQRWWVKQVRFGKGQRRSVKDIYRAKLGDVSTGDRFFTYALSTGASWKGKIGVADIAVAIEGMEDFTQWEIRPEGYQKASGKIVWHFEEFEPEKGEWDIRVQWFPWYRDIWVDGTKAPCSWDWGVLPRVEKGVLRVPLRMLGEWLGASVVWEQDKGRARIERGGKVMFTTPGDEFASFHGQKIRLPVAPYIHQRRLVVPLKAVAEAFGCKVLWDPVSRRTYLRTPEKMLEAAQPPRFMSGPLTREELLEGTMWELRLMRNEVYARHGYEFAAEDLGDHFYRQPWYEPNPTFDESLLTEVQKKNVLLIKEVEEEKERTPSAEGRIAFTVREDGKSEIWVMDADGSNRARLTSPKVWASQPAWSPDGEKIAFTGGRWGKADIYVMNSDGTNLTRLTDNPWSDTNPSWSPDGSKMVFEVGSGTPRIWALWVMNTDGSNQRKMDITPVYVELPKASGETWSKVSWEFADQPCWSPDGARIAFVGGWDLWVMNADGTNPHRIVESRYRYQGSVFCPRWSPDSRKIAFCAGGGIHVANAEGPAQRTSCVTVRHTDGFRGRQTEPRWPLRRTG